VHPIVDITVAGKTVSSAFYSRLLSVSVTDKEGVTADTFQMELNDGPPDFISLPTPGDSVSISMGYAETGVRKLGDFIIDKVSGKCLPYSVSISGKSAALGRATKSKEAKERHWDNKSLKDIIGQLAGEMGLTAKVDAAIGAYVHPWLGQEDESNIHLLRRLEQRHNGLFTVKGKQLIFAQRGSGLSSSGGAMGTVVATPEIIIPGTCTYEASDRTKYSKVVAYHQDKGKVERAEIEQDVGDGDAIYRIPEPFASIEEADKAAESKAKELKRGEGSVKCAVVGDNSIVAGVPLSFARIRPQLDGVPYIIDTATHTFSKGPAYHTEISGKLYDGSSASGGGGGGAGGGTQTPGSCTSGAPTPTPSPLSGGTTAPAGWGTDVRNGYLDSR